MSRHFSGSMFKSIHHRPNFLLGDRCKIFALGEVLVDQTIGMLIQVTLP